MLCRCYYCDSSIQWTFPPSCFPFPNANNQREVYLPVPHLPPLPLKGRDMDPSASCCLCKYFLALTQALGELRSWATTTEMVSVVAEGSPASWKMGRESSIQGVVKGRKKFPLSFTDNWDITLYITGVGSAHTPCNFFKKSFLISQSFWTPTILTWSLNYLPPFTFIHLFIYLLCFLTFR